MSKTGTCRLCELGQSHEGQKLPEQQYYVGRGQQK